MSHPDKPEYFTLSSVCEYDGSVTTHGIFENIDAVYYRLKQMYTRCGNEYHIECFHLSDAETEAKKWSEENVQRKTYQREAEMKEARLKEWEENHEKWDELNVKEGEGLYDDRGREI